MRWRHYGLVSGKQTSNFAFSGDGPSHRRNEIDFHELGARCVKPYSASYSCSHGPVGRLYPFNAKQISEDRPHRPVATAAQVWARFSGTRGWFCSQMQRSDRPRYARVGTTQPHPIDDVAERSGTGFYPQVGTDAPRATSVCYVSHEVDIRTASEDERKPQPPESNL